MVRNFVSADRTMDALLDEIPKSCITFIQHLENPSWICVISAQGLKSKHQSDIAQNSNELNLNGA